MVDILSTVDLTSISAMLAAIGVTIGVVFAILELLLKQDKQTSSSGYMKILAVGCIKKRGGKS